MHMIIKRLIKWLVRAISVFLPEAQAHELQRWRRGREEFWKYNKCQYIFASYGKSGRTWVRVMISRYYQLVYKLPDNILMGFDNFTRLNKDIPRIFFTHDNYLRGYTGNVDSKKDFYNKNTVLLVRNPIDVAVSQFFQWKYRMRPEKKAMNKYPEHEADISVYDFVKDENQGLSHIVDFHQQLGARAAENTEFAGGTLRGPAHTSGAGNGEDRRVFGYAGQSPSISAILWNSPRWRICARRSRKTISGAAAAGCRPRMSTIPIPSKCAKPRSAATSTILTTSRWRS